jgi:hypothetical protein
MPSRLTFTMADGCRETTEHERPTNGTSTCGDDGYASVAEISTV